MNIDIAPLTPEQTKPIPSELTFGTNFTNRMFSQKYTPETGWHSAQIGPYQPITLDPSALVFHYGQEIFEGTKAYRRPDGHINLFRPWDNAKRFNDSAERMSMQPVDVEDHVAAIAQLVELEHEWVPDQQGAALYIRPTMIATDEYIGMRASQSYLHYIITCPVGNYYSTGLAPVSVFISNEYRRAVKGGTGAAKTGGNYAASLMVSEQVKKEGFVQVLWLDAVHGRYVEEVGTMNIMFVYDGRKIVTPKLTGSILPGITRASLLTLAPDLGYEVEEGMIDVNEMLADVQSGKITEVFGCGTAVVISPVGKFGYEGQEYIVNNNEVGPVASKLYQELTDIQFGRKEDPYGWTYKIEVPKAEVIK
jgi:branched-chain amino acid aminotransferase